MSDLDPAFSAYATLRLDRDGPVGTLTLNRPERHNAFDDVLVGELDAALKELAAHPAVRVVVMASAGKSFCAGADLNWMKRAAAYSSDENLADSRRLAAMLHTLHSLGKPTIARVQGAAYGGGVGLIAACDMAVALAGQPLALTEVKLGILPAVISPYVIAALGERQARRYMLTAERFDTGTAHRLGLVHELAGDEAELDAKVAALAGALAANSPQAVGACKDLIGAVAGQPIGPAVMEDTARRITAIRASDEGREGIAAFLEKRPPAWLAGR